MLYCIHGGEVMDPDKALKMLIKACKKVEKIGVKYDAKKTAADHFNLPTNQSIYGFIANGGLECVDFINKKEWKYNPRPENKAKVYSYSFYSHALFGYLAFIVNPKSGYIMIKSLKKNTKPDQRNLQLKGLQALLNHFNEGE